MLKNRWISFAHRPVDQRSATVLVVDDEEPVRRFVATALQRAGYDVTMATDGAHAVTLADTSDAFDVLVTDLQMPGMTGDVAARELRRRWPSIKVLYLTGHADQLFAEKLTLWDGEVFLDKPCEVAALLEAMSLLTSGRLPSPNRADVTECQQAEPPASWRSMTKRDDWSPSRD
jgi:CheY-like chemotaxis protein